MNRAFDGMKGYWKKLWIVLFLLFCASGGMASAAETEGTRAESAAVTEEADLPRPMKKVRLTWQASPRAVFYQVVLLKDARDAEDNIAWVQEKIFTNGVEIDLTPFGDGKKNLYWKVCPLNFDGRPLEHFSEPKSILETGEFDTVSPLPTTEFDKMAEAPLYPVYSWIPMLGAEHHEVEVYRRRGGKDILIRRLAGGKYDVYENGGYTYPDEYCWRVRSVAEDGAPLGDWSEKVLFRVSPEATVAALGDSVTHGGGAFSVPPGYVLYNWDTYCAVPVKNLGRSGDTTEQMLDRFERDVLPFHPKILVIMGGVNDFRGVTDGWTIVRHLKAIGEKCEAHGILPVFATVTPINPKVIALRGMEGVPGEDWLDRQRYVNHWVMSQKYAVDVSGELTDADGNLKVGYSTDGIHPDFIAKKHIGETIGAYLLKQFPEFLAGEGTAEK